VFFLCERIFFPSHGLCSPFFSGLVIRRGLQCGQAPSIPLILLTPCLNWSGSPIPPSRGFFFILFPSVTGYGISSPFLYLN